MRSRVGRSLHSYLLDALRLNGEYPRLAERARRKQAVMPADHRDAPPNGMAS
jgi:hypothetical protein